MANVRLIARLDIKGPNLIKGVHLEGLRVIGDPNLYARKYYAAGVDEILYMDIVASLYRRNNLADVVRRTVKDVFVPITVGGGIRSVDDAREILRSGADKVAVNTAATERPQLIAELSQRFGCQCIVLSIEAMRRDGDGWEADTDNGREHTGLDVVEWAARGAQLGAGEILITSVDQEGTRKGFDIPLIKAVSQAVSVPVIASGGMGKTEHGAQAARDGNASAVAMADVLHYGRLGLGEIRETLRRDGIQLRKL